MKMKIMPFQKCCLSAAIVNTAKKWDDHHLDVMKTVAEVAGGSGDRSSALEAIAQVGVCNLGNSGQQIICTVTPHELKPESYSLILL